MEENHDSERVQREISILSKVEHPNIVYLYEILDEKDSLFFTLEYCSGGDVGSYVKSKERLTDKEASGFF